MNINLNDRDVEMLLDSIYEMLCTLRQDLDMCGNMEDYKNYEEDIAYLDGLYGRLCDLQKEIK